MIDREMISAKFDIIEKDLEFLEEFNKMDDADFLNSYKNIQSAKGCGTKLTWVQVHQIMPSPRTC